MDALFHGLSVVTVSWLVACPQALVRGGLGGLGTAILLQSGMWDSPYTGLSGTPSWGLVVEAGAGSWSMAAGGAQAASFTSTG